MKLRGSIVWKIWSTIILLLIGVLSISGLVIAVMYEKTNIDRAEKLNIEIANKLTSFMKQNGEVVRQNTADESAMHLLEDNIGVLIFENGERVYRSPTKRSLTEKQVNQLVTDKKIDQQLKNDGKINTKYDFKVNKQTMSVELTAKRFALPNDKVGTIYVYKFYDDIVKLNRTAVNSIVLSIIVAIIITTFISFLFSSRMVVPLNHMRKAAKEIAKGNFHAKIPPYTHDEIGELGNALQEMSRQLQGNIGALQQEKEQFSNVLIGMADAVIKFDVEQTIILSNPPAEEFLHHWFFSSENETRVLVPPVLSELIAKAVEQKQEITGELTVDDKTYVAILTLLYDGTNIRSIVVVLRDMTEERRLEKMKTDFVNNVSHELRTPISMLQGYSEAIIDGVAQNEEEVRAFAEIIYEESLRIGRLVNEMLDLARMEAGFTNLDKKAGSLTALANKVTANLQVLAEENHVSLAVSSSPANIPYFFDQDRMEQVFINLIMNAIQHTGREGHEGKVAVQLEKLEDRIKIAIQDNGAGISEADIPYLFERFYKADKARIRGETKGTGIGLAIVKNIVDAHGGYIKVESVLGKGSSFIIQLPLQMNGENTIE